MAWSPDSQDEGLDGDLVGNLVDGYPVVFSYAVVESEHLPAQLLGTYRSQDIQFTGQLVEQIESGYTTTRLYEWLDHGYLVYLVHVAEDKPGRLPRRTLYPFTNCHLARTAPKKGYSAKEVAQAYPEFANGKLLGRTRSSPTR
jgi:hypothetical protein